MTSGRNFSNLVAGLLLAAMFFLLFFSSLNDSAIMDELAHIPAAYSYVALKDMRLNPEHPPLIKDLAALLLVALHSNFPTDTPYWRDDVNGQWAQGTAFLYESGNNPDKILFLARLPIMLLAILFGWLLFKWARSIYGSKIALFTTFLYALSPTFLAHSRYVTTDLAASFGFFIGIATFLRFLEKQTWKRLLVAGVAFGIAQLLKFSLFLLVPIFAALALLWVFLEISQSAEGRAFEISRAEKISSFFKKAAKLFGKLLIIGLIGLVIIWVVYLWHVWNYPQARQFHDAESILSSFGLRPVVNLDLWFIKHNITRPLGQYLLGLLMVIQRAGGGNMTYYLGEMSAAGWRSYFPVAYLLKETLAFHLLALIAIFLAICNIKNSWKKSADWRRLALLGWLKDNFALTASIFFISFYWLYSMKSPLNIGVRHILPTFPFIYLLVSREIISWLYRPRLEEPKTLRERLRTLYKNFIEPVPKLVLIAFIMLWLAASIIITFPFYLSYYNELVGTEFGYLYIVDSNYDWGQDLKRLGEVIERENIPKIYLDYFGGGSPRYYFREKFEPWSSSKGSPPPGSYFAISATLLQNATGKPVQDFQIKPEDTYSWLKNLSPTERAGTSIFIYKIP
ncbi:MAG: glycosyltransferase family 39 protein [bacterium]|nr:glycosyltransferase family 39 protein [bacterium]